MLCYFLLIRGGDNAHRRHKIIFTQTRFKAVSHGALSILFSDAACNLKENVKRKVQSRMILTSRKIQSSPGLLHVTRPLLDIFVVFQIFPGSRFFENNIEAVLSVKVLTNKLLKLLYVNLFFSLALVLKKMAGLYLRFPTLLQVMFMGFLHAVLTLCDLKGVTDIT